MSTHSRIGILNLDGSVTSIYCHSDGYLSGVGAMLLDFYKTEEKVRVLMALGNISTLGTEIGEKHDFNNYGPTDNWCRAYGRDRGERDIDCHAHSARTVRGVGELLSLREQFTYVFNPKTCQWFYSDGGHYANHENALPRLTIEVIKSKEF